MASNHVRRRLPKAVGAGKTDPRVERALIEGFGGHRWTKVTDASGIRGWVCTNCTAWDLREKRPSLRSRVYVSDDHTDYPDNTFRGKTPAHTIPCKLVQHLTESRWDENFYATIMAARGE